MEHKDHLGTAVSHLLLCCVAGRGIGRVHGVSFSNPGMHANFFIHGVFGFLHFQSKLFNSEFREAYILSLQASKYLALPCLMADLYRDNQNLCAIHLLSGIIPFVLALAGNDNPQLGNLMVAGNVASLCYYSHKNKSEWGWFTAIGACVAYFLSPRVNKTVIYPLALTLMEDCAYRVYFDGSEPPPAPTARPAAPTARPAAPTARPA